MATTLVHGVCNMVLIAVYIGRVHGLHGVEHGWGFNYRVERGLWFTSKNMDGSDVRGGEGVSGG